MALKGFPFTSIGHDRRYGADDWTQYFSHFVGNGVFAGRASELQVVQGTNMAINVLSGSGWIDGVIAVNSGSFPITLGNASGVATRIDRIVLRLNMTDRTMELLSIQGITEAAPPLVRDGTFYDLGLANIYVAAGTTAITQAMIADTRFDSSVCGIVKGLIEEINPTNLFAQYDAEFQAFKGRMSADDIAASLQMQINAIPGMFKFKTLYSGYSGMVALPKETLCKYQLLMIISKLGTSYYTYNIVEPKFFTGGTDKGNFCGNSTTEAYTYYYPVDSTIRVYGGSVYQILGLTLDFN